MYKKVGSMKKVLMSAVIASSIWFFVSSSFSQTFECAFIQEKYKSGKPNKAACSMLPEEVFSTGRHTPRKNEHCEITEVYNFEDFEDVIIDTKSKLITWTKHLGLTEDAKLVQKEYYINTLLSQR
jgi:hypothetical protein